MGRLIIKSGLLLIVLLILIPDDQPAQTIAVPFPEPVTGSEEPNLKGTSNFRQPYPGYKTYYQQVVKPNATIIYATLPGIYTVYDLQSNAVPQQIWQDPLRPQNVHAIVMRSTQPGFATRESVYFFSFDYGATWNYYGSVPSGNFRSGFPSISGFENGAAVIACHDNSGSSTVTNIYYDIIPGGGVFTRLAPGLPASQNLPIWPRVIGLPDNTIFFAAAVNGSIESYTNKATNIAPPGTFSGYQLYDGDQAESYSIAVAPNGIVGHAYIGSDTQDPNDVFYRFSLNGGLSFSNPLKIWDWNTNTDSLGCLRGVSMVYDNNNQPLVAFNTSKLNESGFFPEEPSQIRVWSPGVNGGVPRVVADSSNVPFYPNTGIISDAFLPLCRPAIGRSSAGNSIAVAFSATTEFTGSDSSRYFAAYIAMSHDAGNSWFSPDRITPTTPLRDWRFVSISPTSYQSQNSVYVQLLCQSDSLPGTHVNGAPIGRGEFVNIRYIVNATSAPSPPALLLPQNGTTLLFGNVLLDWSNVSNAQSYSVQLTEDSLFSTILISQEGLTQSQYITDTLLLDYGRKYFWRARAVNEFGTSNWSDYRSFSFFPRLPLAPVLISPPDGSTGNVITPRLIWSNVPNAYTYSLQVARDQSFNTVVLSVSSINLPEYNVPSSVLNNDSTYFWRVSAQNNFGSGQYSTTWSFTVRSALPPPPMLHSPPENSTVYSTQPTLSWLSSLGAESYKVQVSTDSLFGNLVVNQSNIVNTNYLIPAGLLVIDSSYYWRACGVNSNGSGQWSGVWKFTVRQGAPPPALVYPPNGQTGLQLSVNLDWSNSTGANNYDLLLATDSVFANVIIDARSLTNSAYTAGQPFLTYFTTYYWKVRANNSSGYGDWTNTWRFTTVQIGIPTIPTLLLPANSSSNISVTPYLDWSNSANTSHYKLWISLTSTFDTLVFSKDTILPSEFTVPDSILGYDTLYYWKVMALNYAGASNWSQVFRFRTVPFGSGTPAVPVLLSPPNNATNVSAVALLDWGDAMLAVNYHLNIATDLNFNNMIQSTDTITLSQYKIQPGILNHNTLYFWRVRAINTLGQSKWSSVFVFRTALLTNLSTINGELPEKFELYDNSPNPFNPVTKIKLDVPRSSQVRISVYDLSGKEVSRIADGRFDAGSYETVFDASMLPSGIYFCRMTAESFSAVIRMALIK